MCKPDKRVSQHAKQGMGLENRVVWLIRKSVSMVLQWETTVRKSGGMENKVISLRGLEGMLNWVWT